MIMIDTYIFLYMYTYKVYQDIYVQKNSQEFDFNLDFQNDVSFWECSTWAATAALGMSFFCVGGFISLNWVLHPGISY